MQEWLSVPTDDIALVELPVFFSLTMCFWWKPSYRSSAFAQQEIERDVMVSTPTPRAELILALLSHR